MQEYLFTSAMFSGSIMFTYDEQGRLVKYENNAILNEKQWLFLSDNMPFLDDQMQKLAGTTGKIEEITDLTFERFWKTYNYKKDRASAERFWHKLSNVEKARAIQHAKRYRHDCIMQNRDMVYAVRYLKNKRYLDE